MIDYDLELVYMAIWNMEFEFFSAMELGLGGGNIKYSILGTLILTQELKELIFGSSRHMDRSTLNLYNDF